MKMLKKAIIRRTDRVIQKNEEKIAERRQRGCDAGVSRRRGKRGENRYKCYTTQGEK